MLCRMFCERDYRVVSLLCYCYQQASVRFCANGSVVANDLHVQTSWHDMYERTLVGMQFLF